MHNKFYKKKKKERRSKKKNEQKNFWFGKIVKEQKKKNEKRIICNGVGLSFYSKIIELVLKIYYTLAEDLYYTMNIYVCCSKQYGAKEEYKKFV